MSDVFDLDAMRKQIDEEYAPVKAKLSDGSEAVLRPLLRLPSKDRANVLDLLDKMDALESREDTTQREHIEAISQMVLDLLKLAVGGDQGKKLANDLGDDTLLAMKLLRTWQEATQMGEAQDSPA